ncbi:hypothetical protein BS329_16950 [Amycolatopsis coloradensis]|uniref:Uncharacterized protein n=1 Tax=Amycolatopsis coloradensis TaxID=76021 RepID=A0A1R0KU07_9PSEU|nr:DUF6114 domain-containing protein [Amycolatopsis coloradensis]OLZ51468.1 hypothetical protein BS329_16950 [Amycolatopsis coloradensis]
MTGGVPGRLKRRWRAFRGWRRQRPFAAGLFLILACVAIGLPPFASFRLGDFVLSIRTIGGMSGLLIAALLLICTGSLWSRPQYRVAAGVTAILVSLVALVSTNLGGFLVGTVLGLVGGALALSWAPPARPATTDEPDHEQDGGTGPPPPRFRAAGTALVVLSTFTAVSAAPAPAEPGERAVRASAAAVTHGPPSGRVWVLKASVLRLAGLSYLGVGTTEVGGATVEVLRFTANRVEITSLEQSSELVDGRISTISAPPGSVSVATGKPVELFTLRITGTLSLLGLIGIPVDFTPAHPPPLVLPYITLTNVTVVNTDLKHARLSVPHAKLTIT